MKKVRRIKSNKVVVSLFVILFSKRRKNRIVLLFINRIKFSFYLEYNKMVLLGIM